MQFAVRYNIKKRKKRKEEKKVCCEKEIRKVWGTRCVRCVYLSCTKERKRPSKPFGLTYYVHCMYLYISSTTKDVHFIVGKYNVAK